jgi:hypothetical protein
VQQVILRPRLSTLIEHINTQAVAPNDRSENRLATIPSAVTLLTISLISTPSTSVKSRPTPLIVRFYDPSIKAEDSHGRTLNQILKWDDAHLERSHDYIQMIFPLPEGSMFSFNAPIIDEEVMLKFRSRAELRQRMSLSLNRMLQFYGFTVSTEPLEPKNTVTGFKEKTETNTFDEPDREATGEDEGKRKPNEDVTTAATAATATISSAQASSLGYYIVRGKNWDTASCNWTGRMDHNHLRITRILRSLRVLGLQKECEAFFKALQDVYNDPRSRIGERSMMFWERAVKQPLHIAPDGERIGWLKKWEVNKTEEDVDLSRD